MIHVLETQKSSDCSTFLRVLRVCVCLIKISPYFDAFKRDYIMTKGELFDELDQLDDDVEIRFASQPSWPFEYSINNVVVVDTEEDEFTEDDRYTNGEQIVYLVEGKQIGYLPGNVKNEIGW